MKVKLRIYKAAILLASHAGVFRGARISWGGTKYELT